MTSWGFNFAPSSADDLQGEPRLVHIEPSQETWHYSYDHHSSGTTMVRTVTNSNGEEIERSISEFDQSGRILESTSKDKTSQIHLTTRYAADGALIEILLTFKGKSAFTQRIEFPDLDHATATGYGPDGAFLGQMTLPKSEPVPEQGQIQARDSNGNWIRKTIRGQTIHRTITY